MRTITVHPERHPEYGPSGPPSTYEADTVTYEQYATGLVLIVVDNFDPQTRTGRPVAMYAPGTWHHVDLDLDQQPETD